MIHHQSIPCPGLHPPRVGSKSDNDKLTGRRLLGLIRSIDNKEKDETTTIDHDKLINNILSILKELSIRYSVSGLLQGDVSVAEKILLASTISSSNTLSAAAPPRERQKDNNNNKQPASIESGLKIFQDDGKDTNDGSNTEIGSLDATLVLTAFVRVFTATTTNNTTLIMFAANTCASICERIQYLPTLDSCARAEYELLTTHGKPLLVSLCNVISVMSNECTMSRQQPSSQSCCSLASCLRASSLLISLLGAKLSRNTQVLTSLRLAGFQLLVSSPSGRIQSNAASLIVATTLTGGPNKSSPSVLWNQLAMDCLSLLMRALHYILPVKQREKAINDNQWPMSNESQQVFNSWQNIRQLPLNGEERVKAVLPIVNGLTKLMATLFSFSGGRGMAFPFVDAKFSFQHVLDVLDTMLSFPTAAESLFHSTKKRLRFEIPEQGWLNPTVLVMHVANYVKLRGCEMLEAVISGVGSPPLLPHGRRLLRLAYSALFTAISSTMRKVLDPATFGRLDGKSRRWLHKSIRLRAASIRVLMLVVTTLGPNSVYCSMQRHGSVRGRDIIRAISALAGTLLEQIGWPSENENDDWGSISERGGLACEAADALAACLTSCGEFLPVETRSLVDSVMATALSALFRPRSLASWLSVKVAVLRLAARCLSTPWPDGATSLLTKDVLQAANRCTLDSNPQVSTVARDLLQRIQTQLTPRAPPLLIVTRNSEERIAKTSKFQNISSASTMLDKIAMAQKELSDAEKSQEQQVVTKSLRDKKKARLAEPNQVQNEIAASHPIMEGGLVTQNNERNDEINSKLEPADQEELNHKSIDRERSIPNINEDESNGDEAESAGQDNKVIIGDEKKLVQGDATEVDAANAESDDEDFPMIVDVDPDAEDM